MHGIVSEERDLVIGTHGRGFYVLDDINVLRQAAGDITASALHVFQPNNPLRGLDNNVAIDYYLGKDADEVKIEFSMPPAACCARSPERRRTPADPHRGPVAAAGSAAAPRRASASRRA